MLRQCLVIMLVGTTRHNDPLYSMNLDNCAERLAFNEVCHQVALSQLLLIVL